MEKSLQYTNREIEEIYERHRMTVYRVCYTYLKQAMDTEDAVQETFFRLIRKHPKLEGEEHEKAWLIRTAVNICKDELRKKRRRDEDIEDHPELQSPEHIGTSVIMEAVLSLPEKYKTVLYLYYYEGYDSAEIAAILKRPKSTIRNYLHEARMILKERLGDYDEE